MENGRFLKKRDGVFLSFLSLFFNFMFFLVPHQTLINFNFLLSNVHSCDLKVLLHKCFSETKGKVDLKTKAEFLFLVQFRLSAAIFSFPLPRD